MRGFILFLLLVSVTATASAHHNEICKKIDPQGQVSYYACGEPEKTYPLRWNTSTTSANGKLASKMIELNSVCSDYTPGEIDYRYCRDLAKNHFEEQCDTLKRISQETRPGAYAEALKIEEECFCTAARQFQP